MNPKDERWKHGMGPGGPEFDPHRPDEMPPLEDDRAPEGEPQTFGTLRRIEYIGRLHHMTFSSILSSGSLSPAQIGALTAIIHSPGMSQRELSDELHIQRATTTVMLQKMERAGYIDRRPDAEDQRIYRIYPTDAAIELENENHKIVDNYFSSCFEGFTQADFDTLQNLLSRLGANIRAASSGNEPKKE